MSYRHVVWDLGGTLIDTYPAVDALFAAEVERAGGRISVTEVAALTRRSTSYAMACLEERFAVTVSDLTEAYARLKDQWVTAPPPVMADAHRVLAAVHAGGGKNLVVTHRDRQSAVALLQATELAVDDMLCGDDGYRRKPDPQMYRVMLARHGLAARDCLAVGDRAIDAGGAGAVGMTTVYLSTAQIAAPADLVCDYRVAGLDEVLILLAQ